MKMDAAVSPPVPPPPPPPLPSEDPEPPIIRYRPLIDFIKDHTHYLPTGVPYADYKCSICLETVLESHERAVQVDVLTCHHIFGATCFERYIQYFSTCPLCRELWFDGSTIRGDPATYIILSIGSLEEAARIRDGLLHGYQLGDLIEEASDEFNEGSRSGSGAIGDPEGREEDQPEDAASESSSSDLAPSDSTASGEPPAQRRRLE